MRRVPQAAAWRKIIKLGERLQDFTDQGLLMLLEELGGRPAAEHLLHKGLQWIQPVLLHLFDDFQGVIFHRLPELFTAHAPRVEEMEKLTWAGIRSCHKSEWVKRLFTSPSHRPPPVPDR